MAIFGRFTQRAQRAVAAAQQAAVLLHQPYVGTEHILLGLLKEPGPVISDVLPEGVNYETCLLYTSPSPRDGLLSRMPSSA